MSCDRLHDGPGGWLPPGAEPETPVAVVTSEPETPGVPEPGTRPASEPGTSWVPGSEVVPEPGTPGGVSGSGTDLELVPDLAPPSGRLPLTVVAWLRVRGRLTRTLTFPGSLRAIPRKVKAHQPRTWRDHSEYIGAREWMTWAADPRYSYLEGWLRTFIYRTAKWGGVIYGHTLGKAFILAGMWLQEIGHRQSRFWLTVLAFAVLVAAWKLQHILFG